MKNPVKCLTLLLLAVAFCNSMRAQEGTDYAVHANIIYRFTKYVNWPTDKKTGDFIIGVVGNAELYEELRTAMTNKTAGSQRIIVKKYSASAAAFGSHILFVGEQARGSLKKITTAIGASPTLIVTESEGLAQKGSCINFVIVQDHLKLEINKDNIEQRNLDIANELLNLGKLVK